MLFYCSCDQISADTDLVVKNAAELLDRHLKDVSTHTDSDTSNTLVGKTQTNISEKKTFQMVGEMAQNGLYYTSTIPAKRPISNGTGEQRIDPSTSALEDEEEDGEPLFSLEKFIPLLQERIYVVASTARMHLLSWIDVSAIFGVSTGLRRMKSQACWVLSCMSGFEWRPRARAR